MLSLKCHLLQGAVVVERVMEQAVADDCKIRDAEQHLRGLHGATLKISPANGVCARTHQCNKQPAARLRSRQEVQ